MRFALVLAVLCLAGCGTIADKLKASGVTVSVGFLGADVSVGFHGKDVVNATVEPIDAVLGTTLADKAKPVTTGAK